MWQESSAGPSKEAVMLENNDQAANFTDDYKSCTRGNGSEKGNFIKLFDKVGCEILQPGDSDNWLNDLRLHVNCYFQEALRLDTVSFLFGTGSSIPLGAKSIFQVPEEAVQRIKDAKLTPVHEALYAACSKAHGGKANLEAYLGSLLTVLRASDLLGIVKEKGGGECAQAKEEAAVSVTPADVKTLSGMLLEVLIDLSDVPAKDRLQNGYKEDPLHVHKEFIRKVLARPVNLKRVNLFTTNYDVAFERAMDQLGVIYVDGFVGNIHRAFRPEAFNYDYYFPASTTEGSVHRLEKVLHLYKLHGSLNWAECASSADNVYGIEQLPDTKGERSRLVVYPRPMKEEETLGFPYSEMFRRFATTVQQPQNVLVCYGYGFGDQHVNRVIYNALSISTFQLVVVSYGWTDGLKDFYGKVRDDSRISFMVGPYMGDWRTWVYEFLPDIRRMELETRVAETLRRLKGEPPVDKPAGA
jgi:hypothetical protein